MAWMRRVFFR
uniref:Uncharacterized protein n=1 Tax=Rhizophora mucronata TaxID=61149 RepID=A0A2P2P0V6_RHIMU